MMTFVEWHRQRILTVSKDLFRKYGLQRARNPLLVLDAGCGDGEMMQHFLQFPQVRAYGVDMLMGVLKDGVQRSRAVNAGSRALFLQASIENLSFFPDQTFDVIYEYGVLSLIPHPQAVYDEYMRLVKPGGILIVEIGPKWSLAQFSYLFVPSRDELAQSTTRWQNLKFWKRWRNMRFYTLADIEIFLRTTGQPYRILERIDLWYYYFDQRSLQALLNRFSRWWGERIFDRLDMLFKHFYRIPSGFFLVIEKLNASGTAH